MAASVPPAPQPEAESFEPRYLRLGEILIERGKIEAEDLERALELQQERGDKIGKILVDMGLLAQRDVLAALSEQLGVPLVSIDGPPPVGAGDRRALAPLPAPVPRVPGGADGFDPDAGDGRSARFRDDRGGAGLLRAARSRPLLAPEQEILDAIEKHYGEAERQTAPRRGWTRKPAPISSTCATWRARRRSSAW